MKKKVIEIKPKPKKNNVANSKKRVAAYARVSSEKDEQLKSLDTQKEYYENYIKSNPEWEFVEIYYDEGITGTSLKHRDGFNRMIEDALNGKIDVILVKSVSRYARNTLDALKTTRDLKDKSIPVFFEKENIDTLDPKGEFMLTLFCSFAQEESKSISENVKWGIRKGFKEGRYAFPFHSILGYRKNQKGEPAIFEEEAKIIRLIYKMYLERHSTKQVAEYLTKAGVKKKISNSSTWCNSTVLSILKNEKYCGDAILQKTIITDPILHHSKANEGEERQYKVIKDHPAIIPRPSWELVQNEFLKRLN